MAVAYFHRTLSFNVTSYLDVIFTITTTTTAAESSSSKWGGPVWLFSAWPWILTTHCTGPRLLSSLVSFSHITSFQCQCHDKYTTTSITMRELDKTSLTALVRFLKIYFWRKCLAAMFGSKSIHWWRCHETRALYYLKFFLILLDFKIKLESQQPDESCSIQIMTIAAWKSESCWLASGQKDFILGSFEPVKTT